MLKEARVITKHLCFLAGFLMGIYCGCQGPLSWTGFLSCVHHQFVLLSVFR